MNPASDLLKRLMFEAMGFAKLQSHDGFLNFCSEVGLPFNLPSCDLCIWPKLGAYTSQVISTGCAVLSQKFNMTSSNLRQAYSSLYLFPVYILSHLDRKEA